MLLRPGGDAALRLGCSHRGRRTHPPRVRRWSRAGIDEASFYRLGTVGREQHRVLSVAENAAHLRQAATTGGSMWIDVGHARLLARCS